MKDDISRLLEEWDYKPGQVVARRLIASNGREIIQLRIDLGVLQMYTQGRPDGKRPFGKECLLEHYKDGLERFKKEHDGDDADFTLPSEDCMKLHQEALQYHHRYICLLQLDDFDGVLRDTQRNREAFDFVEEYAENDDLAWSLQQFRPQLLMMETRATASHLLKDESFDAAINAIEVGIHEIRQFFSERSRADLIEFSGEIQSLESWLEEVREKKPITEREQLERDLAEAVRIEDYEKAAKVRDALKNLSST